MAKSERPIIIVKRQKRDEGGHHGGAWKVAYADFVTAMMAFFLLLWLLNAVTEEQLNGVADYFTPIAASTRESGAGGMLEWLRRLPAATRKILIHINNTNPILNESSPESAELERSGVEVAWDGMEIVL